MDKSDFYNFPNKILIGEKMLPLKIPKELQVTNKILNIGEIYMGITIIQLNKPNHLCLFYLKTSRTLCLESCQCQQFYLSQLNGQRKISEELVGFQVSLFWYHTLLFLLWVRQDPLSAKECYWITLKMLKMKLSQYLGTQMKQHQFHPMNQLLVMCIDYILGW